MKYGERLEHFAKRAKKSRAELGAAIGCSVQNIGMIYRDVRGNDQKLLLDNHFKAAEFLGVDPIELYTGIERPVTATSGFSAHGEDLAILFDLIPASSRIARAQAYNAAMGAILDVLQQLHIESGLQAVDLKRLTA